MEAFFRSFLKSERTWQITLQSVIALWPSDLRNSRRTGCQLLFLQKKKICRHVTKRYSDAPGNAARYWSPVILLLCCGGGYLLWLETACDLAVMCVYVAAVTPGCWMLDVVPPWRGHASDSGGWWSFLLPSFQNIRCSSLSLPHMYLDIF
jgi:hypothetical protein